MLRLARRIMRFEVTSPGIFYLIAFFVSFQFATLFTDIRNVSSGSWKFHQRDHVAAPSQPIDHSD
jgi:hypothetical protein